MQGKYRRMIVLYNYLGVLFSTKLSFTEWYYDVTSKAKNAVLCIMQKLRMLNNNSFELFLKLFDSQVQQSLSMVVSYGVLILQRFIAERSTYLRWKGFYELRCELQMTLPMVKQIGIQYLWTLQ